MPQLWEVRKGVGVHQSQLKNQAADVMQQLLALHLHHRMGQNYLFIYLFWHKWKYPLQKGRGRIILYISSFHFSLWPQNVSFYLYYLVTYTARESRT